MNSEITLQEKIFSVSEITTGIKCVLESHFQEFWIEGEITNLRIPSSGHMYFSLKDANAQISAVHFKGYGRNTLKHALADGLKVLAYARVDVYEKQGKCQLRILKIEPKGVGALQLAFEALKKKLRAEGLFDESVKKSIPQLPQSIGIVTSPTGAAIRDILNIIERRFSNISILINPVRVQGDGSSEEIAAAIDQCNELGNIDVIIVTRGGGSLEDLWAFNEEAVARAIYRSSIPVISAVGHEIDYTISDFTADLRCPTPSAAAELVIGKKSEFIDTINNLEGRLSSAIENAIQDGDNRIKLALENRFFKDPKTIIRQYQQHVDNKTSSLDAEVEHLLTLKRKDFILHSHKLEMLSPLQVLERGYSVTLCREKVLKDARVAEKGDIMTTVLKRGKISSQVIQIEDNEL